MRMKARMIHDMGVCPRFSTTPVTIEELFPSVTHGLAG